MSQYGMQMPGGRASRGPTLSVLDALLFLAVIAMGAACVFVYQAAVAVAPEGNVMQLQEEGNVRLADG
ncbi:MAG: hypothetical protein AAFX79_08155 [Planctomycetota bacterium]